MLRRLALLSLPLLLAACGSTKPALPPPPVAVTPVPEPPEAPVIVLAPTFGANEGRLPWPADGTVTGFFGRRTDPETGTLTDAVGLDIATAPAEPVRAAFGGRVSRVGTMAAFGTYVMLKHGGFTTVYGNLSRVDVQASDTLGTGAVLGLSGTRDDRRGSGLFFAVYEGDTPVDPLSWLRPRSARPLAPEAADTTRAPPEQ